MRGSKAAAVLAATLTATGALTLSGPAPVRAETAATAGHAAVARPSEVAGRLFRAWLRKDRRAASAVATPAAVNTIFGYPYRAPDRFAGCIGDTCRFVHTSVRVPGGLNGILMVVSGPKVARVYTSRHLATGSGAATRLFAAWRAGDRNRGLEVASTGAVKTLFRTRYGGVGYIFQGCEKERGGQRCAYSYEGGAMFMHARRLSAGSGYWIDSIGYIAD